MKPTEELRALATRVAIEAGELILKRRTEGGAETDTSGRLNGYFERELKPWDHAAAGLIAREAGAVISGIGTEPADSRMLIAAASGIHDQLREIVLAD